jgi:hypothetical protein
LWRSEPKFESLEKLIDKIKNAIKLDNIIFKKHALVRMLERRIESSDIIHALENCSVVEAYHDDRPYPSYLLLGYSGSRPLHIVLSGDQDMELIFIITIYEPSDDLWEGDYKTRRRKT